MLEKIQKTPLTETPADHQHQAYVQEDQTDVPKPCPSCNIPVITDLMDVEGVKLWQVLCPRCGMNTEAEEDLVLCLERWNRRPREDRLHRIALVLGVLAPLLLIIGFMVGMVAGLSMPL
ncbi:hypothetical protein [Spongorhabdus nitratireducens]